MAIQRGPFIYCFEGIDNDAPASQLVLPREAKLRETWDQERQLMRIQADGLITDSAEGDLYTAVPVGEHIAELTAVPYFSWANRGKSTMEIWLHERS